MSSHALETRDGKKMGERVRLFPSSNVWDNLKINLHRWQFTPDVDSIEEFAIENKFYGKNVTI